MPTLHPSLSPSCLTAGAYREQDMLRLLEDTLPPDFDVFHNVEWSSTFNGTTAIGEVDIAVVSPEGHLLLIEVKAGKVDEAEGKLHKHYADRRDGPRDIGVQVKRHQAALLSRLRQESLGQVQVKTLLLLPDHRVLSTTAMHGPDQIVDASDLGQLGHRVRQALPTNALPDGTRSRLLDFLANRFSIVPDVAVQVGALRQRSTTLAAGLATWVPSLHHSSGLYVVDATAGSGKTQLAVTMLAEAQAQGLRGAYICFNRPLADHMAKIAPTRSDVMTFHEACVERSRRAGQEPNFQTPGVYQALESGFMTEAETAPPRWDLLVVDETQDFKPEWVQALLSLVKEEGRAYLLGDPGQQLYGREGFALEGAVTVRSRENFRSPRQVVETINLLRLTAEPVLARSPFPGDAPGFHTYAPGKINAVTVVQKVLEEQLAAGVLADQIAVLSFTGQQQSEVMKQTQLAGLACRRPTGSYDRAGNAIWTDGELLVDTLYRFKGQSAPVVILCEIDFEILGEQEMRKLFVGLTRAQYRVECVLSERAAELLAARMV